MLDKEDVLQIRVPIPGRDRGLNHTLVYLVKSLNNWILIDTGLGTDEGYSFLTQSITDLGFKPDDIKNILITHGHPDHHGLSERMREWTGAQIAMHQLDAKSEFRRRNRMDVNDDTFKIWNTLYGIPIELMQKEQKAVEKHSNEDYSPWRSPVPESDILIKGNEELFGDPTIVSIWTPGHSPGHICVYDKKRKVLFSGDHVLPRITPNISMYPGDNHNPLGQYIDSLTQVEDLDVETVYPAHQGTFTGLKDRVVVMKQHHEDRIQEMTNAIKNSSDGLTAWQVASNIHWNVGTWENIGFWTRRMATTETLSHLEYMYNKNIIKKTEHNSQVIYQI